MKKLFALISLLGLVAGMGGALNAQEELDKVELRGRFAEQGVEQTLKFKFSATPGDQFVIAWGQDKDTITAEADITEFSHTFSPSPNLIEVNINLSSLNQTSHLHHFEMDSTDHYSTIDFENCPMLKSIHVTHNTFENFMFRNCPALTFLDCSYNKIGSLFFFPDSNWYDNLTYLNCSHNDILEFTATDCIALETLDCSNNPELWSLTTDDCKAMKSLDCSNTQLLELYLPTQSVLQTLDCSNTQLNSMYLSELPALRTLDCSDNPQLTQLTIQCPSLDTLLMNRNPQLFSLSIYDSRLTGIDLSDNTALIGIVLQNNTMLETLDLSNLSVLEQLTCTNSPELKSLDCSNTQLTSLYLSELPELRTLDCSDNPQLTSLSLSELPELRTLDCSDNPQLTDLTIQCSNLDSLNMHGNTQLTSLNCRHNQLSSLDVTDCHNLQFINCTNNHLSFIDLPKEFAGVINCDSNHIPLSGLASLLKQCAGARFDPQLIINRPIQIGQTLDLRSEMQGSDYNVEYTVYIDSTEADNRFDTIRNGLFAFHKSGNYRVKLSSSLPLGMNTILIPGSVYYDLTVVDSVVRPQFSIPSGAVLSDTALILSTPTPDARIYYTTDGSEPDETALAYTTPIRITEAMTVKAIAIQDTFKSYIATASYRIDTVARPTFSIASGKVKRGTIVSLSTTTSNARIIYTTDGSEPDNNALEYTEPIRINEAMAIKAVAVYKTVKSKVAAATYTVDSVANENDLKVSKLRIYAKNQTIYLSEAVGEIEVFTMDGHCVYRGFDTVIPVGKRGLYIVSAAGRGWKVSVR